MTEKTETQLVREAFEQRIKDLERALETALLTLAAQENTIEALTRTVALLNSMPGDGSALQPPTVGCQ